MKLLLANIQRFSLRDGPGIRTTAFLKGCNLRCQWCHNPETWEPVPECQYLSQKCLHCGICFKVCPNGCFKPKGGIIDISRSRCSNCQQCIHACPTGALSIVGKRNRSEKNLQNYYFVIEFSLINLEGVLPSPEENHFYKVEQ